MVLKIDTNIGIIADLLEYKVKNEDREFSITGISSLKDARANQLCYCRDENINSEDCKKTKAGAIILSPCSAKQYKGNSKVIEHVNPEFGFSIVLKHFFKKRNSKPEVHKTAIIEGSAEVDPTASIGPGVFIGKNCKIAAHVSIAAGSVIGDDSSIGQGSRIYPNVVIYERVKIGTDCIIHSGACIGSDGFGYARNNNKWEKLEHIGGVVIGNDVEIGACTTIDKGMLTDTIIEDGVKLDNSIQIGHNVKIGSNTAMAACSGVAGSTVIGSSCMIGGGSLINGHISIASGTILFGGSNVMRTVDSPGVYGSAITLMPRRQWLKFLAIISKITKLKVGLLKSMGL